MPDMTNMLVTNLIERTGRGDYSKHTMDVLEKVLVGSGEDASVLCSLGDTLCFLLDAHPEFVGRLLFEKLGMSPNHVVMKTDGYLTREGYSAHSWTFLSLAARNHLPDACRHLLSRGADPNFVSDNGLPPLFESLCFVGKHGQTSSTSDNVFDRNIVSVVQVLLDGGATIREEHADAFLENVASNIGAVLAIPEARNDSFKHDIDVFGEALRIVVEHCRLKSVIKVSPFFADFVRETLFDGWFAKTFPATIDNVFDVVLHACGMFLSLGASPSLPSLSGMTPLQMIVKRNPESVSTEVEEDEQTERACRLFLDFGADPNGIGAFASWMPKNAMCSTSLQKTPPLSLAASKQLPKTCRVLLWRGANPNAHDPWENTAMHLLASGISGKYLDPAAGILSMLLDAGGDINSRNSWNLRPFEEPFADITEWESPESTLSSVIHLDEMLRKAYAAGMSLAGNNGGIILWNLHLFSIACPPEAKRRVDSIIAFIESCGATLEWSRDRLDRSLRRGSFEMCEKLLAVKPREVSLDTLNGAGKHVFDVYSETEFEHSSQVFCKGAAISDMRAGTARVLLLLVGQGAHIERQKGPRTVLDAMVSLGWPGGIRIAMANGAKITSEKSSYTILKTISMRTTRKEAFIDSLHEYIIEQCSDATVRRKVAEDCRAILSDISSTPLYREKVRKLLMDIEVEGDIV